jgi:hypothetical protein
MSLAMAEIALAMPDAIAATLKANLVIARALFGVVAVVLTA